MEHPTQTTFIDEEKRNMSSSSLDKDQNVGTTISVVDKSAERAYGTFPAILCYATPTNTVSPQTRLLPASLPLVDVFLQLR